MFVHQEQLEHVLRPEHYYDPRRHDQEVQRLFLPGWHMIGCRHEWPRDGDFRTLELFGLPVLVRNFSGELHGFLNVCAHRHCRLTNQTRGRSPRLKCQYHGWEYDETGRTNRIPDARCFRPFDREHAQLRKFRVATCGELVFLSLAEDGPSLPEYLGRFQPLIERYFAAPWRSFHAWEHEVPVNWKALVENTLESYHMPEVHPVSFGGVYPREDRQEHELHDTYNSLAFDLRQSPLLSRPQAFYAWLLGNEATNIYAHRHLHPGLVVITTDVHAFAVQYQPTGPRSCLLRHRLFGYRGVKRGPAPWVVYHLLRWFGRYSYRRIVNEDLAIAVEQQKGLEASPHRGCLGTREERVYAFQRYVADRMASNIARPHSDVPSAPS